jgi:crotonobetainyl-CoA:carnitine CoA-transferase CaiB-like acyl-CoA transferase
VNNIQQTMDDPQVQARGAFQENRHPVIGVRPAYASPVFIEGVPRAIRSHGPLWGEHNDYVCRELLGLPQEAVSRLVAAKALR